MAAKMMACLLAVSLCVLVESVPASAQEAVGQTLYQEQSQLYASMVHVQPASASPKKDTVVPMPNVAEELAMAKEEYRKARAMNHKWRELQAKKHVDAKLAIPPRLANAALHKYAKFAALRARRIAKERVYKRRHPIKTFMSRAGTPPRREDFEASSGKCRVTHWGTWSKCKNPCSRKEIRVRLRYVKRRNTKLRGHRARLGCRQHARQHMMCYADAHCRVYQGKWQGRKWRVGTFQEALWKEGVPIVTPGGIRRKKSNKSNVAYMPFVGNRRRRTQPWRCTHPKCHHTLEGPAFYENALTLKAYINLASVEYFKRYGKHPTQTGCIGGLIRRMAKNPNGKHPQHDYDTTMNHLRRLYTMGIPKYMLAKLEDAMSHKQGIVKVARPSWGGSMFAMLDHKQLGLHLKPKMFLHLRVKARELKTEKKRLEHNLSHYTAEDVPQGRRYKPCDCTGASVRGSHPLTQKKVTRCVRWKVYTHHGKQKKRCLKSVHAGAHSRRIGQHCARWNKTDAKQWCVVDKRCDRAFPTRDRRHKWNYCTRSPAKMAPWTKWSKCSARCNGGHRIRTRTVISLGNSKRLPRTRESQPCAMRPCHGNIANLPRKDLVRGIKSVLNKRRHRVTPPPVLSATTKTGDGDHLFFEVMGEKP